MSQVKQIEEMANVLTYEIAWDEDEIPTVNCLETAKRLYNAGYRKQSEGEWIDRDGKTWCSLCNASNKQYKPPFCPHCGAKMKGGTE